MLGGQPRVIAETGSSEDVRGAAWGDEDRILFSPTFTGPLFAVAASGGDAAPATEIGDQGVGTQRFPSFLSDGRRFVFFASTGTGVEPGTLYLGRLGSLASKKLGPATSSALYAEPGHLIYVQGDSLVAHRFDVEREELVGQPVPLGVSLPGSVSVSGQRSLSVSRNGILVYRTDKRSSSRLVWVDRQGRELGALNTEVDTWYYSPSLSPDGRHLAVSHYEAGSTSGGIWIHDLERKLASRLSIDNKSDDSTVIWSPDGREVAYSSSGGGSHGIYRVAAREPGRSQPWLLSETFVWPSVWLADGRLIYSALTKSGRSNLFIRSFGAGAEPRRLGNEQVSELLADLAPDGRWLALQADPTRRMEIYLRRLDDATGASTLRVSPDGGTTPRFRRDGRELFYLEDSGRLMSVPMKSLDPPQPGTPVPLFDARLERGADRQFDVTHDGQRFILNRSLVTDRIPIAVLVGWQERLRQTQAAAGAR